MQNISHEHEDGSLTHRLAASHVEDNRSSRLSLAAIDYGFDVLTFPLPEEERMQVAQMKSNSNPPIARNAGVLST